LSLESDLFDALKGLVGNRVYPDVAPQGVARPYIVYQQVGGRAVNFVDPTVPSKKNARIQVAAWADTRAAASALGRQIEDTLRAAAALQITVLGAPVATYDEETKFRGTRQDFSAWF
jgi:hypothetical protein